MNLHQHLSLPASSLHWLSGFLWKDRTSVFAYTVAIVLATIYVLQKYPLDFLLGSQGFLFLEQGDPASQVAGWLFYMHDSWHLPLLHTYRLGHPDGVNIAFADTIPLAALFFKLIRAWLPTQFHYIGIWHAVAFLTQALAATFLMRSLGQRHLFATVVTVLLCLTWPALLWRTGHAALMTHALILCSLALYFLGRLNQRPTRNIAIAFITLNIIGLMIHPYYLAFCYPIFLAFLCDQALSGDGWKRQLPALTISMAAIALVGIVFGYFGQNAQAGGFTQFSMNLVAPFCGVDGQLISCFVDKTGGQSEGYNYLGAGILLLIPFAVVMAWPEVKILHRRFPALLITLALFTIYSASSRVYFGSQEIFSYSLPTILTATFRASGRFFWVVGYVILFATLAVLFKKASWRTAFLIVIAFALQWTDLTSLRSHTTNIVSAPGKGDLVQWGPLMGKVDKIHVYPAFGCGALNLEVYWHYQRVASHFQKLLDTGYMARHSANCENNKRLFADGFKSRHLYVMASELLKDSREVPAGFKEALQQDECVIWKENVLCLKKFNDTEWKATGLAVRSP